MSSLDSSIPPALPQRPKKRFKKRWLLLLVPVLLLVALRVVGGRISRPILFPVNPTHVEPPPSSSPDWAYDVVEYETEDGVRLTGLYIKRSHTPGRPAIVFFHGNGQSAGEGAYGWVQLAQELEADVFVAEYRGYGGASGEPTEEGLYVDGRAAVKATGRDPSEVVLSGWSLGTGVAVELAHEGLGRSVVLLGPFTSIPDVARRLVHSTQFREGFEEQLGDRRWLAGPLLAIADSPLVDVVVPDRFASIDKIDDVKIPVFVVQGSEDEVCAPAGGRALAEKAPHGTYVEIEGAPHYVLDRGQTLSTYRLALGD